VQLSPGVLQMLTLANIFVKTYAKPLVTDTHDMKYCLYLPWPPWVT
jgi:hypothetical protein